MAAGGNSSEWLKINHCDTDTVVNARGARNKHLGVTLILPMLVFRVRNALIGNDFREELNI